MGICLAMLAKSSLFSQISNASLRCLARSGKTGDVLQEFHRGRQGQQRILQSFVPSQVSQRHHMVSCPLLSKTTKIHYKKHPHNISSWIQYSPVQLTSANVICPCLLFYQLFPLFSASAPSKPTAATSCASTSATSFGSSRRRRRATATTTTSRSETANTGTRP